MGMLSGWMLCRKQMAVRERSIRGCISPGDPFRKSWKGMQAAISTAKMAIIHVKARYSTL